MEKCMEVSNAMKVEKFIPQKENIKTGDEEEDANIEEGAEDED